MKWAFIYWTLSQQARQVRKIHRYAPRCPALSFLKQGAANVCNFAQTRLPFWSGIAPSKGRRTALTPSNAYPGRSRRAIRKTGRLSSPSPRPGRAPFSRLSRNLSCKRDIDRRERSAAQSRPFEGAASSPLVCGAFLLPHRNWGAFIGVSSMEQGIPRGPHHARFPVSRTPVLAKGGGLLRMSRADSAVAAGESGARALNGTGAP
jgi:hypothetical protein